MKVKETYRQNKILGQLRRKSKEFTQSNINALHLRYLPIRTKLWRDLFDLIRQGVHAEDLVELCWQRQGGTALSVPTFAALRDIATEVGKTDTKIIEIERNRVGPLERALERALLKSLATMEISPIKHPNLLVRILSISALKNHARRKLKRPLRALFLTKIDESSSRVENCRNLVSQAWLRVVLDELFNREPTPTLIRCWRTSVVNDSNLSLELAKRLGTLRERLESLQERLETSCKSNLDRSANRVRRIEKQMGSNWLQFTKGLDHDIDSLMVANCPAVTFTANLDQQDNLLAGKWERTKNERGNSVPDRLLSARHAEKAAIQYYENLGHKVEDVSLGQLAPIADLNDDWHSHDIRIDGKPIDIKNARRRSADELREHLWKDHKRDRQNQPVGIVGVVTTEPLDSGDDANEVGRRHSTVLGFVNKEMADGIAKAITNARSCFGLRLSFTRSVDWAHRIDGWLYEYPDEHYERTRVRVLRALESWWRINQSYFRASALAGMPELLLTLDGHFPDRQNPHSPLVNAAKAWFSHLHVTRATVFLFALLSMLAEFKRRRVSVREELKEHMFLVDDKTYRWPLGLHDEQGYVGRIIDAIHDVITEKSEALENISAYRVTGFNVLKGQIDGDWHTVLAYCHCGESPLLIGNCHTCNCGEHRLRCPACGRCGIDFSGGSGECFGKTQQFGEFYEARNFALDPRYHGWALGRSKTGGWEVGPLKRDQYLEWQAIAGNYDLQAELGRVNTNVLHRR